MSGKGVNDVTGLGVPVAYRIVRKIHY